MTGTIQTPREVGQPPATRASNHGQPGAGPDQIFGTGDDGTPSTIGSESALIHSAGSQPRSAVNIAANNSLDLNNFHVKFDYVFNQNHRDLGEVSLWRQPAKANRRPGCSAVSRATSDKREYVELRCAYASPAWQA